MIVELPLTVDMENDLVEASKCAEIYEIEEFIKEAPGIILDCLEKIDKLKEALKFYAQLEEFEYGYDIAERARNALND